MRPAVKFLCLFLTVMLVSIGQSTAAGACTVRTSAINFGAYDPLARAPARSVGTITYHCPDRPPAGIKIMLTHGQSGTGGLHLMTAGSAPLPYRLCLDPSCLESWGDGSNGTGVYFNSNPPLDQDVTIHVYGLVPQRQPVSANREYRDTLAVIAEF